ncbi:DIL domain containing protein [Acanthamoeba castellanii str. Neff]|uniref:DIL domain containing protein n=1 Tax=Acanthamoeba castellanii (strain ATCC 30010 / Neff) TaxID=1257118 RepID=L8HH10_ACACF|nr:DIL domain containing protein [Acanthamoeba castellanii str. Neff]ELR24502.1 DIL domain containing protein [Acanthamoeba castellanii str. Neff]
MKRSSKTKEKIGKADKKAKRNVKIKFTLQLKSLLNLSPALNDSDVSVAWKRGSKKTNKGESEGARVKHGAAEWKKPQAVSIDATLIQYPTLHKFQQKTIEFTLKQSTDKKKANAVTTFEVDLAQYATDKTDELVTFPIVASKVKSKSSGPLPPISPTITFNIKAEWLKIGNKKIVSRSKRGDDDDYDLQTDADDDDQSETDIDDSDMESDSDMDDSDGDDKSKGGGGMDGLSYSLDYPVAAPSAIPLAGSGGSGLGISMQNGLNKEIEKELKQLQKEVRDLKKEMAERDQAMVELIELRARLDTSTAAGDKKKNSGGGGGSVRGWKEIKKEMTDLKRWIEKKDDEAASLRKELEKGGGGKGKKGSAKGDKENGDGSGGGGGADELEETKKRLKEREEELKRVMKQAEQQEEELEKMQQIVDTVTRSGDKSGTIKLTSAQLKTMSGELKVKKELELEREKAKQKEKELDSSVRMLKTKEDEVKKLTKHNEQQEKKIKKLQEELEQLKQEAGGHKKVADGSDGTSGVGSPGGGLLGRRKKSNEDLPPLYGEGSDSGTWKVGGGGGVISTIRRKALSPRQAFRSNGDAETDDDDVSDRSEGGSEKSKKKKKKKDKGKEKEPISDENEILEKCIYCADPTKFFTYEVSLPMASSMDLNLSGPAQVTMQAGIPVAAKDLFMFLRETEALMAHALNQPLLQRIINALFIAVENASMQCYWMAFCLSLINQIGSDKQITLQPGLDVKLLSKLKNYEKKGILFEVNSAKPPKRPEDVLTYFVRQMNVVALRAFLNLHLQLRVQIVPILLPSILGQHNVLKAHFAANVDMSSPALLAVKFTPKDITRLLSSYMDDFARNYIFPSVMKQFLLSIYRSINVAIFNAIMSRKELCTASNGYQIRFGLAQLTAWPFEITPTAASSAAGVTPPPQSPRDGSGSAQQGHVHAPGSPRTPLPVSAIYFDVIDAGPIVQELEPTLEAAGVLVLDKTQLNSDDGLRHAAPFLHPVHLNHLLLSFTPDELSPNPVPDKPKKLLSMIISRETNLPPLQLPDIPPVRFPSPFDGDGSRAPARPGVPPLPSGPSVLASRGSQVSKGGGNSSGSDGRGDYDSDATKPQQPPPPQRWQPATSRGGGGREPQLEEEDELYHGNGYGSSSSNNNNYDDDEDDDDDYNHRAAAAKKKRGTTKAGGGYGGGGYNPYSDDDDDSRGGLM